MTVVEVPCGTYGYLGPRIVARAKRSNPWSVDLEGSVLGGLSRRKDLTCSRHSAISMMSKCREDSSLKRAKPTLADIARRTGFGTNTVSLALRNSRRISERTREIIGAAARELDYVPNLVAKSLAANQTHTVGLILHDITNPILTKAAKMIQLELAGRGYSVLFATSDGSFEEELRAVENFRAHMVDGLLIYPLIHDRLAHLVELRAKGFPVVLLIGAEDAAVDAVGVDEFRGANLIVKHLIDLGHRRIGMITQGFSMRQPTENMEKFNGYKAALRRAKITLDRSLVVTGPVHSIACGADVTGQLMSRAEPPTAVFAASDVYALGALHWAAMHGVRVPRDLAIAGFDDIENAQYTTVPLTTYKSDVEITARRAVDRLIDLIAARKNGLPPPQTELVNGSVIERESTVGGPRRLSSPRTASRA